MRSKYFVLYYTFIPIYYYTYIGIHNNNLFDRTTCIYILYFVYIVDVYSSIKIVLFSAVAYTLRQRYGEQTPLDRFFKLCTLLYQVPTYSYYKINIFVSIIFFNDDNHDNHNFVKKDYGYFSAISKIIVLYRVA